MATDRAREAAERAWNEIFAFKISPDDPAKSAEADVATKLMRHVMTTKLEQIIREELDKVAGVRQPDGCAYQYHDCIRYNHGETVNGSDPIRAIPLYFDRPPAGEPPTPRCPRCQSLNVSFHYRKSGKRIRVECRECPHSYNFFPATQPAPPDENAGLHDRYITGGVNADVPEARGAAPAEPEAVRLAERIRKIDMRFRDYVGAQGSVTATHEASAKLWDELELEIASALAEADRLLAQQEGRK